MTSSINPFEKGSSVMDGDNSGNQNKTTSGVEFGLRPRTPGVLYFEKFPPPDVICRLVKDQRYCVGIDKIDGVTYRRFEKRSITNKRLQRKQEE